MAKLTYRLFIDGVPVEDLSKEQREEYAREAGAKLESVMQEWFGNE